MHFSAAAAVFAATALTAFANAYTTPVGDNPSGNSITKPGLAEIVPAGSPYTIVWTPTTPGTVTLVLLRGPGENIKPLYPIVENIPNSGSYTFTPSTSLEADTSRYGIQLIDDATGAYQYTSQFGVSVSGDVPTPAGPSTTAGPVSQIYDGQVQVPGSSAATTVSTLSASVTTSASTTPTTTKAIGTTTLTIVGSTTSRPSSGATITQAANGTTTYYLPTGSAGVRPSTSVLVLPATNMTVPATLKTSASSVAGATATTTSAIATGGAERLVGGALAGVVGVACVFWGML